LGLMRRLRRASRSLSLRNSMHSIDLKPEQFSGYPPEARKLAIANLAALQRLPLSFLPSLLREVIDYDFKFHAERKALERELANLSSLSPEQTVEWFRGFAQIRLSSQLEQFDWVNAPAQYVEQLSAYLWTTHQLDAFRVAALAYADRLREAVPPEPPAMPRLGITVIGQGVTTPEEPLFRKLRPHGVYYSRVQPENGLKQILEVVAARAKAYPAALGHWYIDGGQDTSHDSAITCVSFRNSGRRVQLCRAKYEWKSSGLVWDRKRCARYWRKCGLRILVSIRAQ
jgi:hypothetical protein